MKTLYPELNVYPLDCNPDDEHMTEFFARDARLRDSLDVVAAAHDELTMVSVGCAYGAELDSALAVARNRFSAISATGLDKNGARIAMAEQGAYQSAFPMPPGISHFYRAAFQKSGIEVDLSGKSFTVKTERLRNEADEVSFRTHDILNDGPVHAGANFIMCHNVLCCLGESVETAITNMTASLVGGGVLSLAVHRDDLSKPEKATGYARTHRQVLELMAAQNMQPVVFTKRNIPIVFQAPM